MLVLRYVYKVIHNIAMMTTTLVALFSMSWQLALVGISIIHLLDVRVAVSAQGYDYMSLYCEKQIKSAPPV